MPHLWNKITNCVMRTATLQGAYNLDMGQINDNGWILTNMHIPCWEKYDQNVPKLQKTSAYRPASSQRNTHNVSVCSPLDTTTNPC